MRPLFFAINARMDLLVRSWQKKSSIQTGNSLCFIRIIYQNNS